MSLRSTSTVPVTLHTFEHYKIWLAYHLAYLQWMKRVDHPDLRASNFNADKFKERVESKRT